MDDRSAFLRAICEDPAADLPRLVYADWLDEHDEPERAEFIRVQVEIGTMLDRPAADAESHFTRTAELLESDGKDWCWEVVPDAANWHPVTDGYLSVAPRVELEFTRGLVAGIDCDQRWFVDHATALFGRCPITTVRITDKRPHTYYRHGWTWMHGRSGCNATFFVPAKLCRLWPDLWIGSGSNRGRTYSTEAEAHAALDAACVAYGRSLVGLSSIASNSPASFR